MLGRNLVLFTTIYPGVERFLPAWHESVRAQIDRDFDLCICLDGLGQSDVEAAIGRAVGAIWLPNRQGDTPAQIRQRGFAHLVERYDGVVAVDSDDILHPTRVTAARASLDCSDITACALDLVDEHGIALGLRLELPVNTSCENVLPHHNVFGLSNSAFRTDVLSWCLPIPPSAIFVDWYMVSRAWLMGARLSFDPVSRMFYRQHGANMARIRPPFSAAQIARDAARVRNHFNLLLQDVPSNALRKRVAAVEGAAAEIDAFTARVVNSADKLASYTAVLNTQPPPRVWWSSIAHTDLCHMWTDGANSA